MEDRSREPSSGGLRELAARLLTPQDFYDERASASPQLFPGQLPENLPVEVPIPDGATIVGCMTRRFSRGRQEAEIVLDVALPAERFRESYRETLLAAGWSEDDDRRGPGGLTPRGLPMLFRAAYRFPRLRRRLGLDNPDLPPFFRLGAHGPRLMVTAQDRSDAPTDVRLTLISGRRDPWLRHDLAWEVIPSLYPPPGVHGRPEFRRLGVLHPPFDARRLGGGSESREPDGAYSYAAIQTSLDLADLVVHYTAQLEGTGWTRTGEGQNGPQAWSAWTLADRKGGTWNGTFAALRLPGAPGRYMLQVHARRSNETDGVGQAES